MMQVGRVDEGHLLRSLATTTLLGYHAPSFTYGAELLLPSEENSKLRKVILKQVSAAADEDENLRESLKGMADLDVIRAFIHHAIDAKGMQKHLYIPEVRVHTK